MTNVKEFEKKEEMFYETKNGPVSIEGLAAQVTALQQAVQYFYSELRKMMIGTAEKCPICGSGHIGLQSIISPEGKEPLFAVTCNHCGIATKQFKTEMDALASWNRRI